MKKREIGQLAKYKFNIMKVPTRLMRNAKLTTHRVAMARLMKTRTWDLVLKVSWKSGCGQ